MRTRLVVGVLATALGAVMQAQSLRRPVEPSSSSSSPASVAKASTPITRTGVEERPPWHVPPDRFVQVFGHRIHYYDQGAGPVLLLVHGFSGSAAMEWGRVIDLLATNHRVVALHQIGFPPSDRPQLPYDTATFVTYLGEFISAMKLAPVTLVGESFGGWVAATYAAAGARPGSTLPPIAKLVIVDGGIWQTALPSPTAKDVFDPTSEAELSEYLKKFPLLDARTTRALALQNTGIGKGEPLPGDLAAVRVPTLVIWGDKDERVPLATGRRLANVIPNAKLSVIEKAGHIPSIDRPTEFARILRGFVDEP